LDVGEARSETAGDGGDPKNELSRKIREHARRRNNWSAPDFEGRAGMLDLYRRRVKMNEDGEQRSVVAVVEHNDGSLYDGRPTWR
jgi:hypothetical protein